LPDAAAYSNHNPLLQLPLLLLLLLPPWLLLAPDVQVRTVAFCGRTSACSRHCAFAFSLIGPGSHMCRNVGRSHRHNHVFYILDFAQVLAAVRGLSRHVNPCEAVTCSLTLMCQ
jgi:hypothetical protein